MGFKKQIIVQRQKTPILLIYFSFLLVCFSSCSNSNDRIEEFDSSKDVIVADVIPKVGTINLPIVIHGSNFGNDKSKIQVYFDNVQANIISATNNHLYVVTPKLEAGKHSISISVDGKSSELTDVDFKYNVTSSVTTLAGNGEAEYTDGLFMDVAFKGPEYLSCDNNGNLLLTDYHSRLRLISLKDNKVVTIMKDDQIYGSCFNNDYSAFYLSKEDNGIMGYEVNPELNWSKSSILNTQNLSYGAATIVADSDNNLFYIGNKLKIVKYDHATKEQIVMGTIPTKLSGSSSCDFHAAYNPFDKYIYISSYKSHVIFRVNSTLETFGSNDFELYAGVRNGDECMDGDRLDAYFSQPRGLAFDSKGNLFVADSGNNVIRKISPNGEVSTYVGNSWYGGHKDGNFEDALFQSPRAIAIDKDDIMYVGEYDNRCIRCISVQ